MKIREGEIYRKWPEFPMSEIQEWLDLQEAMPIYYHFIRIGKVHVVYIMKRKYDSVFVKKTVTVEWPSIPRPELEEFFSLTPDALVEYVPMGDDEHIGCVGMYIDVKKVIDELELNAV